MKLSRIIELLGINGKYEEDEISGINDTTLAKKGEITFLSNRKYLNDLKNTNASYALVRESDKKYLPDTCKALVVDDPYLAFAILSKEFAKPLFMEKNKPLISENAIIKENVTIGNGSIIEENVLLMSGVVIGERVTIKKNTIIYPNVTIYNDTVIGEDCIIHAGAVIGSDGFGYAYTKDRKPVKIYHLGRVRLGNRVEIGANTTIDRGALGETYIADDTKIDNLVQIGHNCQINEKCVIVSQSGLAGSTTLDKCVTLGAQSGTAGHLKIGAYAMVAARGGVTKSIEGGKIYAGFPIKGHKEWLKEQATISKLAKEKK